MNEESQLATAHAAGWCLVSRHRKGEEPVVLFGEPLPVLGIPAAEFFERELESRIVAGLAEAWPWHRPCDSTVFLVADEKEGARWIECCSKPSSDGGLIVSTRPVDHGGYEEFLRTARIALGGSLLGPMAHELNNLVQGLASAEYLFRDCLESGDPIDIEDVDQLAETVARLTSIGAGIQRYARTEPGPREHLRLRDVVDRGAKLLESVGRLGLVEWNAAIPEDLPELEWRPDELEFVILALLSNAVEGSLTMDVDRQIRIRAFASGDSIQLELWNSGEPMDWNVQCRPWVTSKPRNRHLGIGLSVATAIVHARGGSIVCGGGAGTSLEIRLPLVATGAGA